MAPKEFGAGTLFEFKGTPQGAHPCVALDLIDQTYFSSGEMTRDVIAPPGTHTYDQIGKTEGTISPEEMLERIVGYWVEDMAKGDPKRQELVESMTALWGPAVASWYQKGTIFIDVENGD